MLIRNLNQKRILWAEQGIDRWNAAPVARAILRRISRQDTITINHEDARTINRMAEVLHIGQRFPNPFNGDASYISKLEVPTSEVLAIFKEA